MNSEVLTETKGIRAFLEEHAKGKPSSFHMPGHKGSAIYRKYGYDSFIDNIVDMDITEIPGADNLFQQESIIAESMSKYSDLYDVKKSYILVNGSSCGLIASILALVGPEDKLIMARNCHKSVFNALALGNIDPVYLYPETLEEYGILGSISAKEISRAIAANPDARAVILPSPNYYGLCSDIEKIAEECHKRGVALIVDQAHGAHLKFMHKFGGKLGKTFPKPAEECGADIVINSTHKTLASWTQSAILNVCSDRVSLAVLEDKLQQIESSSPSYLLMGSMDINADILLNHGQELMMNWAADVDYFYKEAAKIPGLVVMDSPMLDRTKLNFDMSYYGINGNQMEKYLMKKGVFIELVTGNIVMGMSGIGNTRADYDKILDALKEIAATKEPVKEKAPQPPALIVQLERTTLPREKELVNIDEAAGRICAQSLIPYPPGIPLACPGEIITQDVVDYVKARRAADEKVIGINANNEVLVGI